MNTATTTYELTGMTCQACVKRVQAALQPLAQGVTVQLDPPRATVPNGAGNVVAVTLPDLQAALETSHYRIHSLSPMPAAISADATVATASAKAEMPVDQKTWLASYRPLLLVLAYISGTSVLVQWPQQHFSGTEFMRYFMAGFFLVFSFFKLLDIRAFADAYAGYDLLARRWRGWGLAYPFVELALGVAYLANWHPLGVNAVTLAVMGFSAIGVIRAVLDKRSIRCACLGTVFQLPMSTVTIIEDGGMALMAAMGLAQALSP